MVTVSPLEVVSDLEDETRGQGCSSFCNDLINKLANQYPGLHVLLWRVRNVLQSGNNTITAFVKQPRRLLGTNTDFTVYMTNSKHCIYYI